MTAPTDIVNWNPIDGSPGPPDYSQGPKGDTGATGAPGPTGAKGDKGDPGIQGVQGVKGDKGDQGPIGPGGAGSVGPQGPPGVDGPQGVAGQGIAVGGATGQVLAKNSVTNYDTGWITPSTTPGGPAGGVLGGTYPNPSMAGGAAATNVGTLGGALSGTLPNPTLAAGSVGASQITDGTVGTPELADGAVTSLKIANGTIVAADIATGTITSNEIADGTIATADLANASVTNAKLASDTARANLLTNGGFEVWQRGNGPFTANGAYCADRWFIALAGTDTVSVTKGTGANTDTGSSASVAVSFTLGTGAGSSSIQQPLKTTDGNLRGRTVAVSLRVWSNALNAIRVGVYSDGTGNPSGLSAFHPGGSVWATLTTTVTAATDATQVVMYVQLAASCTAYLDNAMLVVGSVAADYAPLHPADDLARCLRYYETMTSSNTTAFSYGTSVWGTTNSYTQIPFFAQKAVNATMTLTAPSTFAIQGGAGAVIGVTGVSAVGGTVRNVAISATGTGFVQGAGALLANSSQTATISIEANP